MFKQRSYKKEILDAVDVNKMDLFQNLKELHIINTYLGGYAISTHALQQVLSKKEELIIVDIGSGGGDALKHIADWSSRNKYRTKLIGIDLKEACIEYAGQNEPDERIQFICDDYRNVRKHVEKADIIHACLFCHHLTEQEIIELIQFCLKNRCTLIINDLERNRFAYYSIKMLTAFFSRSFMVRNDAPL